MARKSKAEKAFETAYNEAFRRLSYGIQFDMMDLSKIRAHVERCMSPAYGISLDVAMQDVKSVLSNNN